MDSDDLLLAYSLEEMYRLAKEYDADFVNFSANYIMSEDSKNLVFKRYFSHTYPKLMAEENLLWRIKLFMKDKTMWSPWRKFCRRDFLLRDRLFFPENIRIFEDRIWTYSLFLCAKKILHTPKGYYVVRMSHGSLTRTNKTLLQKINLNLRGAFISMKWIDDILLRQAFFRQKPELRYTVLQSVLSMFLNRSFKRGGPNIKPHILCESIGQEFGDLLGEQDILIAQLIAFINAQQKKIVELEAKLNVE